MDSLDLALLREMAREKVMWWGSTDPRLSAGEFARRLAVPASTVRDRLRAWARTGFLPGTALIPNPGLLGSGLVGTSVRVDDPRGKPQVLEDLALVDGALTALDLVGPWIAVVVAARDEAEAKRRRALMARLRSVAEVLPCVPGGAPECTAVPSDLDWRILHAVRQVERGSVAEGARLAGVGTKTFARRLDALIRARALWSLPLFDFTRTTGGSIVRFVIGLREGARPREVARDLRRAMPDLLEVWAPGEVIPGVKADWLELYAHVSSPALVEDVERVVLGAAGVEEVEAYHPRRFIAFTAWFDARIAERLSAGTAGARPRARGRSRA